MKGISELAAAVGRYRARTTLPLLAQGGMLVVAGAAAVTSFDGLRGLAQRCGTPPQITFLLPVAIDAAAAVATLVWLTNAVPAVSSEARRLAWAAIILSVIGNAADHALGVLGYVPSPVVMVGIAAVVGAIPPAIFGTVVHLAVAASRRDVSTPAAPRAVFARPIPPVTVTSTPDQPDPDEDAGAADQTDAVPAPPAEALEGTKVARARAFYRWQRSLGASPTPADVNAWIESVNYVKPRDVEQWEQELTRERLSIV